MWSRIRRARLLRLALSSLRPAGSERTGSAVLAAPARRRVRRLQLRCRWSCDGQRSPDRARSSTRPRPRLQARYRVRCAYCQREFDRTSPTTVMRRRGQGLQVQVHPSSMPSGTDSGRPVIRRSRPPGQGAGQNPRGPDRPVRKPGTNEQPASNQRAHVGRPAGVENGEIPGQRLNRRVRRQGLEPRTRGLRVRCSAN